MQIYWTKRKFLYIKKKFNSQRTGLESKHGCCFITRHYFGTTLCKKHSAVAHFTRIIRFCFVMSRIQLFSRDKTHKKTHPKTVQYLPIKVFIIVSGSPRIGLVGVANKVLRGSGLCVSRMRSTSSSLRDDYHG